MSDAAEVTLVPDTQTEDRKEWKRARLREIARRRSENIDPKKADLDRHIGLEHIRPDNPVPDCENLDGQSSTKRRFLPGDVLFAKLRPYLRKAAQADFEGACTSEIIPIVAGDGVNSKFLLYRLSSKEAFDYAIRTSIGTRMPRTSWKLFRNFELDLPPLDEQRKIASVLLTVDRAIQTTEAIIAQAKRLYEGTKRQLLRNGFYDHSGHQSTATGTYPEDWKIVRGDSVFSLKSGEFLEGSERVEDGDYPVYGGNGIMGYTSRFTVPEGTIVVGRVGAYCGNIHMTVADAWVTDNAIVVDGLADEMHPAFLMHVLRSVGLNRFAEQSAQPRISQSTLKNLKIPVPSRDEQGRIVDTLEAISVSIRNEEAVIKAFKRLKKGLMQDLLTGRVRTADKAIKVLDEVRAHG